MVLVSAKSGFSFWFQFLPEEGVGVFLPPLTHPATPEKTLLSDGRGCREEGRLGVPGQVWEFRFLPSFL